MRTKVTLGLLFLNVALFFYIFYVDPHGASPETAGRRVFGPEAAAIQSLKISAGSAVIALEHRNEGWSLTQPFNWPANEFAVRRILNELQFLESESSFSVAEVEENGQSLADYGLAEPRVVLTFVAAPADPSSPLPEAVTVRVGSDTAVGNRLYVLSPDGHRIHVVRRSLADSLLVALPALRADTVFTIPVFEVRSFNLKSGGANGPRIRLRRDTARWAFEAPIVTRANKTATEIAINELNALRTRQFLDPAQFPADKTGLDASALRITLEGNNRRETLLLGKPIAPAAPNDATADTPREYYAQLEDRTPVFTVAVSPTLFATLGSAQETLRDPSILDFDPASVSAITLTAPGQPELSLQRLETEPGENSWRIVQREQTAGLQTIPADPLLVERLLQRLALIKAQRFHSDAPSAADLENLGFNRPDRTVTLNYTSSPLPGSPAQPTTVTLQLSLGGRGGSAVYARLSNQSFVYEVSPDILNGLPVAARVYRDRLLRQLPAGASLSALRLAETVGNRVLYEHALAPGETWEIAVAAEPASRRTAVEALLAQQRQLRASTFVRDDFPSTILIDGQERPWAYRLDATVTLSGGDGQPVTHTLFFSERAGGSTQFAGSPELSVVFVPEQPLIDSLWTLIYADRDPGPIPKIEPATP